MVAISDNKKQRFLPSGTKKSKINLIYFKLCTHRQKIRILIEGNNEGIYNPDKPSINPLYLITDVVHEFYFDF